MKRKKKITSQGTIPEKKKKKGEKHIKCAEPSAFIQGLEGKWLHVESVRLCRAQGISPDNFQSQRDQAKVQRSQIGFSKPLAEVVGKRGFGRVFPQFPELLSSLESCSSEGAHRAGGWPDVLPGKLWSVLEWWVRQVQHRKESRRSTGQFTPPQTRSLQTRGTPGGCHKSPP